MVEIKKGLFDVKSNKSKTGKSLWWKVPFLLLLIIGTIWIIRSQNDAPYQSISGEVFGTTYHITYQNNEDLSNAILKAMKSVDNSLSTYNKSSIITAINNNKPVQLDDMFTEVFTLSERISKDTEGAFDITVAPLVNTWGFGFKTGEMPTKQNIDSLKQMIGYEKIYLQNGRVIKRDKRIMLDCGAIAKGYGSDIVARLLRHKNVRNFMIEIGGEIVTSGVSPSRLPWKIGVIKPTDDSININNEYQTILNITNKAMATSGNYRRFYYKNGKKYAHTIDPKTGYPVQHNILSSTVIASSCAIADAYATAFMVMGLEKAKTVLNRHDDIMAYFIYTDNKGEYKVWYSPSLKDKILQ